MQRREHSTKKGAHIFKESIFWRISTSGKRTAACIAARRRQVLFERVALQKVSNTKAIKNVQKNETRVAAAHLERSSDGPAVDLADFYCSFRLHNSGNPGSCYEQTNAVCLRKILHLHTTMQPTCGTMARDALLRVTTTPMRFALRSTRP